MKYAKIIQAVRRRASGDALRIRGTGAWKGGAQISLSESFAVFGCFAGLDGEGTAKDAMGAKRQAISPTHGGAGVAQVKKR